MSSLQWFDLPSIYPEIRVWGCFRGAWQYVMSFNTETNEWKASAKLTNVVESKPTDLGYFKTRDQAETACRKHLPNAVH